jgi:hypothetical protein
MANISLSGKEKSADSILNWHEDQLEAITDLRNKIIEAVIHSKPHKFNAKFITFTLDELTNYFENSEEELEHLACLDIIIATEARLRIDYDNRVRRRDKSPIGRTFRALSKKRGNRVSLEEHIIEQWKIETGENVFSDFVGILNYRNWLAHGRYWVPKFGRQKYSIADAYYIANNIFNLISNY